MRVHRRWWFALAVATTASLALLGAYAAALARLPQQRAALEALIRAQTGFDIRFRSLSVRLGLYGPEAHFGGVTLAWRDSPRPLLQASELVARFETWRILRGGSLQPGRIRIVGARVEAAELRRVAARRGAAAPAVLASTPEQRRLQSLLDLARALPPGRVEFESSTVHGLGAGGEGATRSVRIPRLAIERARGLARVQGTALLAEPLGRSLYVALDLRGLDAAPSAVEGTLIVQGRGLRLAGWQSLLGVARGASSGQVDSRVVLWLRAGAVQNGTLAVVARGLRFRPGDADSDAVVPYLAGSALLRRVAAGWALSGDDLRLDTPAGSASALAWRLQLAAGLGRAALALPEAPLAWLQPFAGLPADVRLSGQLQDVAVEWDAAATPRWRYALRSDDAAWLDADGVARLAPLAFALRCDADAARLELLPSEARLQLSPAPEGAAWPISVRGHVDLTRSAAGWRLAAPTLQVLQREANRERPRFDLAALLDPASDGGATLDVTVRLLEPATSTELPWLAGLAQQAFAAQRGARVGTFAVAGGTFAVRAARPAQAAWRLQESRGELAVSSADFRPDPGWPAVDDAGGRLRWNAQGLRFDFERGEVGGLRLLRGTLERGAEPRWTVTLVGPVTAALAALRRSPLAARLPRELGHADLTGAVRFDVTVREPTRGAARWTLSAGFDGLQWRALDGMEPVQALAGTLRVVDGALRPTRLEGTWYGRPLRIALESRRGGRRWVFTGRAPGTLLAALQGEAADAARDSDGWRIEAQPVATSADRWRVEGFVEGNRLRTAFEVRASPDGRFDVVRGAAQFGTSGARGGAPPLPDGAALRLGGALPQAELVGVASLWAAAGPALERLPPLSGSVAVEALDVLGEPVGAATLQWGSASTLTLRGPRIDARIPAAGGAAVPVRIEFARLELPALPGMAALRVTERDADWSAELSIDALRIADRAVGALQARLVATPQRLTLDELQLRVAQLRIAGRIDCLRRELRCDAAGTLGGGGARAALAAWGVAGDFDAAQVEGRVQLSWPATDAADAWAALDGELHLVARDGELGAPVSLGLLAGSAPRSWPWQALVLDARVGAGRVELERLTLDGEQRLELSGGVDVPGGATRLEGLWHVERPLPRALERWPAAPALAAAWRSLRGEASPPQPVQVTGRIDALGMQRTPLQSSPPP